MLTYRFYVMSIPVTPVKWFAKIAIPKLPRKSESLETAIFMNF